MRAKEWERRRTAKEVQAAIEEGLDICEEHGITKTFDVVTVIYSELTKEFRITRKPRPKEVTK